MKKRLSLVFFLTVVSFTSHSLVAQEKPGPRVEPRPLAHSLPVVELCCDTWTMLWIKLR
jgi:hypothetical protein